MGETTAAPAGAPVGPGAAPGPPDRPAPRGRSIGQRAAPWAASPVPVSIVVALLVAAAVVAAAGTDPLTAYATMVQGALTGGGLVSTIERAVPIVGIALGLAVAFRAGVFNIGSLGQLLMGGLAGATVALAMPGGGAAGVVVACLAGTVAGALYGAIPGWLLAGVGAPVLVTSLLLNYPAAALSSYLIRFHLQDPESGMPASRLIDPGTRLGAIVPAASGAGESLTGALGRDSLVVRILTGLDVSALVVLALLAVMIWTVRRTAGGFETTITGLNPAFADYVGVRTGRVVLRSLVVSGATAGFIGAALVLGSHYRLVDGALSDTGYANTALLVVLLGASRPVGVAVAGTFFAALLVGGEAMERTHGLASDISEIIQALVILLIAVRIGWPALSRRGRAARPSTTVSTDDREGKV